MNEQTWEEIIDDMYRRIAQEHALALDKKIMDYLKNEDSKSL